MKLNRQEKQCLKLFRDNNNVVTTQMFINTTLSAEYRKIISLLRKRGYEIPAPRLNRSQPGLNRYTLNESGTKLEKRNTQTIQKNDPCPKCGSYYTRENVCNRCKKTNE